jgi:hypothetical protein
MLFKTGAIALFATAALAAAAPPAKAASFLSVGPNALCGSAGCFGANKSFTQTISAPGGTFNIAGLNLDRSVLGQFQNQAVRISFYTSDGQEVGNWGAYVIAGLNGQVVTLGGQSFDWDASKGDLLVRFDLVNANKGGAGGGGFASAPAFGGGGSFASAASSDGTMTPPGNAFGIQRGLGGVDGVPPGIVNANPPNNPVFAAVVPEPASWVLMIAGFGAAGLILRRERRNLRFG